MKYCLLDEEKICDDCGECNRCDLDPNKICDNCCKCLEQSDEEYAELPIQDVVLENTDSYLEELFRDEEEDEKGLSAEELSEEPDPELMRIWEEKLRALEGEHKQSIPQIHGTRKRKATE